MLRTNKNFLVHSTTRNAPYIHPNHDSFLELWRTFPSGYASEKSAVCSVYIRQ